MSDQENRNEQVGSDRITVEDALSVLMDLKQNAVDSITRKAIAMGMKGLIFERSAAYLVHSIPSDWGVRKPYHEKEDK